MKGTIKRSTIIKGIVIILFVLSLIGFRLLWNNHFQYEKDQPIASAGEIDLESWDFTQHGIVTLSGEWTFFPNMLFEDIQQADREKLEAKTIMVPGDWSEQVSEEIKDPHGYGTYQLRIKVDDGVGAPFKIQVPSVRSASNLYVNGQSYGGSGEVGKSALSSEAHNVPYLSPSIWPDENGEVTIHIEAANFVDPRESGLIRAVKFGKEDEIRNEVRLSSILQVLAAGILVVHAVFTTIMYFIGFRDKRLLCFSLILIMLALINLLTGDEKVLYQYIHLDYASMLKSASISVLILFLAVMYALRRQIDLVSRYIIPTMTVIYSVQILLIIILPIRYLDELTIFSEIIPSVSVLIVIYALIRSRRKFTNSLWVILSIFAIISHFFWFLYLLSTGIKVVHYPFDLIVAIICITVLWFKRYYDLHAELVELSKQLIEHDKTKDEFLTNTSHELRNPLHSILNITEAVLKRERESLQAESINDLTTVTNVSRRMSFMLDELLDMATIEDGSPKLHIEPVSMNAIASGVIDMVMYSVEDKPVVIKNNIAKDLPYVYGDENRLIQVMFNLLHNAIKFTPEGNIELISELKGEHLYISVKDTGIGMDEETLKRIFNRYAQGRVQGYAGQGGFGIGLYVSKQLIELLEGELMVVSKAGQGSTFTFSLPIVKSAPVLQNQVEPVEFEETSAHKGRQEKEEPKVKIPQVDDRPRIIVVDDEPINLRVIETILSEEVYDLTSVLSAEEALDLLDEREWDLVISDVMMPGMSGYELTKEIRQRFTNSELPVLLITARSNKEDLETGFLVGGNDYVTKPVDATELVARVNALTSAHQSMRKRLRLESAWLQAQIKPHFLFNTLNSIIALSHIDVEKMTEVLNAFSDILRAKFNFKNLEELIPLEEELEHVHSYLYIEQVRFGERLRIELDIDEDINTMIPTLSIQPLIENAINHGAMASHEGGTVSLRVKARDEFIEVMVEDDGPGIEKDILDQIASDKFTEQLGIGLININLRLKRIYGEGLTIESEPEEGLIVSFKIPKKSTI